ncbi:MAG: flagellar filament capping protein FliD, partial [Planctomycetota bacterium]|nr:flagellar filament capping protein FliD [Planctomycetota bacterium]
SVKALSDSDQLRAFKAASSNTTASSNTDILTAEASYNAFEGNHSIEINQLANAERWVHTNGTKYKEDYVGAGTFIYSYNHKETALTTTATTTLEDLVGLINNDANNPGVTAGLLYYNDAYHLVLSGNDAGTDYQISVNPSNTEVWKSSSSFTTGGDNATLSTKITDLGQFTGTLMGTEHITISGKKHDGTAVSIDYSINANTKLSHIISEINDAFGDTATAVLVNGEIRLTDNTSGASLMELALTYDPGTGSSTFNIPAVSRTTQGGLTTANLAGFASADFTETQSAQDSKIRVDGYPSGDWISKSSNTIDDVINGVTLHLHDTGTAQVSLTRDIDSVKDKLNAMIKAYNETVTYIKEKTGYNSTTKTGGVLMGDYVVSTIKSQFRSPLIAQTSGFQQDIDTFLNPAQIGLKLGSDGLLSLDTNAFDEAISKDYMGTLAVIGAAKTGSSTSNAVKFYGASSKYTTAGEYNVEVTVAGGVITSARIKQSNESAWRTATFSGNIVTGNNAFNSSGEPVYAENGMQLSVDLTANGTFTSTVRVKQGFTGAIEDALGKMLKTTTGSIQIDQASAEDNIKGLQDKIDAEQGRLTKKQEQLTAQYARLEKTLALIQGQMSALGLS